MNPSFQRARSPDQKEERRAQLLETAKEMLAEHLDSANLSLNELARRAKMAKSNVYRYFESREALLLELLWEEWADWGEELRRRTTPHPALSLEDYAGLLAATAAARPVLCHLTSVLPSVLEHNISEETVRKFKMDSRDFLLSFSEELARLVPQLNTSQHRSLLHHAITVIVGLWPLSHPSEVVRKVLQEPSLHEFRHHFEEELRETIVLLGRGLASSS